MGKVLVLYHSASGNTAKMANLVAEGASQIPGIEIRTRSLDEATADDIHWCDGLAVGSPTNMGVLSWQMKRFWDETMFQHWGKVDGKVACAFSSSGGASGGAEIACQSLQMVLINFGFLVFGVTDYAGKLTTAHYGAIAVREPRETEVQEACRLLGRRLSEWVAVVADGRKDQHPLAKPNRDGYRDKITVAWLTGCTDDCNDKSLIRSAGIPSRSWSRDPLASHGACRCLWAYLATLGG